jgi:hypothetical protein
MSTLVEAHPSNVYHTSIALYKPYTKGPSLKPTLEVNTRPLCGVLSLSLWSQGRLHSPVWLPSCLFSVLLPSTWDAS